MAQHPPRLWNKCSVLWLPLPGRTYEAPVTWEGIALVLCQEPCGRIEGLARCPVRLRSELRQLDCYWMLDQGWCDRQRQRRKSFGNARTANGEGHDRLHFVLHFMVREQSFLN
ncbi:hypothetical protein [Leptolyngbya ohadii]|uniref:hypothetical protein n=1 Tax=Leptolyngbya ohadii TaxID=1962290 RepID=UPI00117B7A42|nr:hypothetical protein [Leptolyngbya ohadii]